MKITILALFVTAFTFAQSGLVKPEEMAAQTKPAGPDLMEHYTNVYKMASSLNDVDQQVTALINIFSMSQKDETLLGLSELYLNKKNYRTALMCANSVKDSTASSVKNMKAWVYKMGGDVKKSSQYFNQLLVSDKDAVNQNAFQIAVNNFEMGKIADAKKLATDYKAKSKADEMVNTTDRVSFYSAKLAAAWENLEGLIMISENGDLAKLKANKDKIVAYFDKAIALDAKFAMPKDNKESFIKLIEDKK
jgi:tetratricopeptide (TPR) repeat protein